MSRRTAFLGRWYLVEAISRPPGVTTGVDAFIGNQPPPVVMPPAPPLASAEWATWAERAGLFPGGFFPGSWVL